MRRHLGFTVSLIALLGPLAVGSGAAPPFAGEPRLVADLNTDKHLLPNSFVYVVAGFVDLGDELFFTMDDGIHGTELWKVDTRGRARMVRDVCPGVCGSDFIGGLDGAVAGGRLVFSADDGVRGSEVWVSDGTAAGTVLLADVAPGKAASDPQFFLAAGGFVYFGADDGTHGRELWRTDGTPEGTSLVADAVPGLEGLNPQPFAESSGLVWFLDTEFPYGLWRSDGTAAGTVAVADAGGRTFDFQAIGAGLRCWVQAWAVLPDGDLLFSDWNDEVPGLWRSDGTPAGTVEVLPFERAGHFAALDDTVLFLGSLEPYASPELWRTDGTPAGTEMVRPLDFPWALTAAGTHAFFGNEDPEHGFELWRSDGTFGGTEMVADIIEGPEGGLGSFFDLNWYLPQPYSELGGSFLFTANDPVTGFELWSTPVAGGGASLVADLNPGPRSSLPSRTVSIFLNHCPGRLDDRFHFFAHDDAAGLGLWRTAGTTATTEKVVDMTVQTSSALHVLGRPVMSSTVRGGRLFFTTTDYDSGGNPRAHDLWVTDGSAAGARLLTPGAVGPDLNLNNPTAMVEAGGKVYFAGEDGALWVSDGTPEGTVPVMSFEDGWPADLTRFGSDVLFFATSDGTASLWRSDGTPENTVALAPAERCVHFGLTGIVAAGGLAFLCGDEALWRTDGTAGGTWMLPSGSRPRGLTPVPEAEGAQALVLFSAEDEEHGRELWRSDGTPEGTALVTDLRPGIVDALDEEHQPVFSDRLCFAADDGVHGPELWFSDGTPEGTGLLADLLPGPAGSDPGQLTVSDERLYFVAEAENLGRELWRSDGSVAGTRVVADLHSGKGSSLPGDLTALPDGGLAFSAYAPSVGRELFTVEPGGLPQPVDLAAGSASSSPSMLRWAADRLFFFANDNQHGFETWAWTTDAFLFGDGFESGDLSEWSFLARPLPASTLEVLK